MILAYNALNAFHISLQKHDALCGLGKKEEKKKGIEAHVNSVKELKRLKKEKIKMYKSVKGEHNVPTRDLSEYTVW